MPPAVVDDRAAAAAALGPDGAPVVVVPVHDGWDDVVACVAALLRHTPADVPLLLIDDGSTDPRVRTLAAVVGDVARPVVVWHHAPNRGFVGTMNAAFAVAGRRDVVLVNSDVVVGATWFERLRAAAHADARVATASPLTNHGSILSAPWRNTPSPLPEGLTPDAAAAAVAAASAQLRPTLPTCVGHVTWVKRAALDLVGGFDDAFAPGYGEEVDFSQRCVLQGLTHVCADDVFVYHRGGGSFGQSPAAQALRRDHEALLAERYPYYHPWVAAVASAQHSALAATLATARRALLGIAIAVDGTPLGKTLTGTQRALIEVVHALVAQPGVAEIRVVLNDPPPAYALAAFEGLPRVQLLRPHEVLELPPADVAYRPVQVFTREELALVRRMGRQLVVTQLDLIAFSNPGYFPDPGVWLGFRDTTRLSLAAAAGVAFISRHAEQETRAEGLLLPGQPTAVTYCGTDHAWLPAAPRRPAGLPARVAPGRYVLCFGTDFRHKNRRFAVQVARAMQRRGWDGTLVLAGPRVDFGSSRPDEDAALAADPALAAAVATLPQVDEEERAWLYANAALVLYPTLYEGFGLVPFEAAEAGVACLSSRMGSLDEVLPADLETIADWDPDVAAAQALALLADAGRREAMVAAMRRRAADFTWRGVAEALMALFVRVQQAPPAPAITGVVGERAPEVVDGLVLRPATTIERLGLHEMYPEEFHEMMRAIGQRRILRGPLTGLTVLSYRAMSRLRTLVRGGRRAAAPGEAPRRP